MLGKVLKKLHLNTLAAAISLPLCAAVTKPGAPVPPEEAEALLRSQSPDPNSGAYHPDSAPPAPPQYDLDIIIPVYKVESYLPACAESVLTQKTRYRFRAIFVDDGSPDSCGQYLDTLPQENVLVLHQENRGLSGARNTGIAASSARYLLFLDSDDLLAEGAVEALLTAAFEHNAALVQGAFTTFSDGKPPKRDFTFPQPLVLDPPADTLPGYAWGKCVRADYFRHLRFPEGYWFEDSVNSQLLFPLIVQNGDRIVGLNQIVCHYRENPQGISAQATGRPKSLDSFYITRRLHQDRSPLSLPPTQADYEYILRMVLLTYARTEKLPDNVKKALLAAWSGFLKSEFPDFHTENSSLLPLEKALHEQNYPLYSLCCKLL